MPLSLFESTLFQEAPGDVGADDNQPPEVADEGPPDIGEDPIDDEAPDLPDMDFEADPDSDNIDDTQEPSGELMDVGDKISIAMNYRLYQRFLTLLNTVSSQMETIKATSDMILTVSPKAVSILEPLGKLGENIRLYMANSFLDTNYSRNLLFYNKCLNLTNMLNDILRNELKKTAVGDSK